ncbi:MAG: response regulator [Anaerolineae bacterium]|nr:response regulator [Anaerolineae bacterium]
MSVILLIENNPVMRPALRDLLRMDGQTVITAMDVPDALSLLSNIGGVDLILANVATPDVDSVSLVIHLRNQDQYKTLPLLMFSIKNNDNLRQQIMDAGADGFLSAPFTLTELKSSVQRLLT